MSKEAYDVIKHFACLVKPYTRFLLKLIMPKTALLKKIVVLKQYDQPYLRQLLKLLLILKYNGTYQKETPPFILNEHLLAQTYTFKNRGKKIV